MNPAIDVRNVSKRFRLPHDRSATLKYRVTHLRSSSRHHDFLALDDVSFEIPEGQFAGIIGANGSGKSTLLKILSRIYQPTRGSVSVSGRVSPFLELGVGFNPELTARENVILNGSILGLTRRELQARMDYIIHFSELEQFADTKLKNFSSGMQVRLAFTVAIQAEAGILLMDEVLAVGDARFQAKCFDIFARYKREGRTIVLVTHDLSAVDLYCDRAIFFDHGRLTADGHATEVTARYRRMVGEQQEAEHTSDSADIGDEPASASHWGNGDVRIRSVRLLAEDGSEHSNFTTDRPMTIRIEVHANRSVSDLVIGIGLHRADGLIVGGTNTHIARAPVPDLEAGERLMVDYEMRRLPLLAGSYRLTIAAHPEIHSVTYDHLEQAIEFRVTDETGRTGMFELGGRWHAQEVAATRPAAPAEDHDRDSAVI